MIILKKDRNFKNVLAVLTLFIAAFALDATTGTGDSDQVQEARFLGIGVKHEVMPCVMGVQGTIHTATFLWIKLGDSWVTYEDC